MTRTLPTPDPAAPAPGVASPTGTAPPDELLARLARHAWAVEGAFAPNTLRALRADLGQWSAWCASRGVPPLPAAPDHVASYVDARGAERAVATVRRYLASIAFLHRAAELPDPTKANVVRLAVRRLARRRGTRQRQAAPFGGQAAGAVAGQVTEGTRSRLIDLRDAALLLVTRDLLARRAEVAALRLEDLEMHEDGSATILVARSKTDQEGRGAVAYLGPQATALLRLWLDAGGISDGALFRAVRRSGRVGDALAPGEVGRILKKLAARAGLDPSTISGHSCRVGMAQDLVAFGLDLPAVMQAGRWKTPAMPARYAERLLAGRGAVARFHGGALPRGRGGDRV